MAPFDYSRLPVDSGKGEIRLLDIYSDAASDDIQQHVIPSANAARVRCALRKASLSEETPFSALSYVWGDEKNTKPIILNVDPGTSSEANTPKGATPPPTFVSTAVTSNLEAALYHLRRP